MPTILLPQSEKAAPLTLMCTSIAD